MTNSLPTDDELFAAVKLDDKKAFNSLYERHWAAVYKKTFFYLHDTEACMGIVNDIFVNIWEKRGSLNIITFKNYLTAAARYRVYNFIKANNTSRLTYVEDYERLANLSAVYNDAENNFQAVELNNDLGLLLGKLPARCKEIFLLSRVNNLTNTEIALKLSISKRTVENQISFALKYLKPYFKHYTTIVFVVKLIFQYTKYRP
ncbi:RNA polymerase sigma-70 factor, ECF subfamily [Mucilaginibacter pineti]|uniref:RNA polymerase sigma-70 factor, ECF subfamily n=1 Tax=Mucilaginibacter pineti TaxID=1391627 RepID=A0A1G7E4S0_9SPHI|nr:sigma-70 family RNA polymerase sigma factor [Mucilaginibacter pineti]SDE58683.1 RNA polymerase sigma-70 factor, ECF subfamily [Mucilaginibacter pineti]